MRISLCSSLFALAGLILAGCGTHRSTTATTAPVVTTESADASVSATALGATPTTLAAATTTLGGPLAGLDAALLARFEAGRDDFAEEEGVDDGIGPVFNETSCVTCHNAPVGGTTGRAETRFGRIANGRFDPLDARGGSLMQDHAIGEVPAGAGTFTYVPEVIPPEANVHATRITTPLFGLGLVDAVPDAVFLLLARLEAFYSPSTRGVPNLVTEIRTGATRVGRFGWKAQVPTLHQFSGDAYLNEMGITSPEFPTENCPQGDCGKLAFNPVPTLNNDGEDVDQFTDFMTLLGPPPRGPRSFQTEVGSAVFYRIGCANCHTPSLVTGFNPIPALSRKVFQPYSDFLLHDMGALGDGIEQGRARGRQMRTAPLWGLSARPTYLHDGRASTVEGAISAHSGQGAESRARFRQLDGGARAALLAFLRSL
jgi:CxxC motif-containing protein (DUF1111 family)